MKRRSTDAVKLRISNSLKKSHANGIHPGWSHINSKRNRRSYPEKFILEVLKKKGIFDKFTVIEKFSISKYFLDFAIIEIKLNIEVDGVQHYRTDNSINHDKIRNSFLEANGWKIYRICWLEFFNNSKNEVNKLISFILDVKNKSSVFYDIESVRSKIKTPKYGNRIAYFSTIKLKNLESNKIKISSLINSNIDFLKYGWVKKASKIIGIEPQKVKSWMERNCSNFYSMCYVRNGSIV